MRKTQIKRKTKETEISATINLDGSGMLIFNDARSQTQNKLGFFCHMLELFCFYSKIDLSIEFKGDLHVDDHHTIEDIAIVIGMAIRKILDENNNFDRFGECHQIMDETLTFIGVDMSGRSVLSHNINFTSPKIGSFSTEMVVEFLASLSRNIKCAIHINVIKTQNNHHLAESVFKGLGRAMFMCLKQSSDNVKSTKGVL